MACLIALSLEGMWAFRAPDWVLYLDNGDGTLCTDSLAGHDRFVIIIGLSALRSSIRWALGAVWRFPELDRWMRVVEVLLLQGNVHRVQRA